MSHSSTEDPDEDRNDPSPQPLEDEIAASRMNSRDLANAIKDKEARLWSDLRRRGSSGYGTKAHIVTPFAMDLNGNAITVSNDIWSQMLPNIPKGADGKPERIYAAHSSNAAMPSATRMRWR